MTKEIKIGCEIFIRKNNMLLLGKRKNCDGEGTWAPPGGHLEYGETLIGCAKRELLEELGIEDIDLKLITITDNITEQAHYIHVSFLADSFTGEIELKEPDKCFEWKFFDIADLPPEIFVPHQKILKTYFQNTIYINNHSQR